MKNILIVLSTTILFASCSQKPTANEQIDTETEMQELQAWKAELATKSEIPLIEKKSIPTTTKNQPVSSGSNKSSGPSSQQAEPAQKGKTGISNTAKGAIIGGVVGAGTGAVVNKKNRAAGAVVGGLVGAGTGAVIGNIKDKKEQQKQ